MRRGVGPQDWAEDDGSAPMLGQDSRSIGLNLTVVVFFFTNALSWSIITAVPALYRQFERNFVLSSLELGALRALLGLCQFGTAPVWAYFSTKYSRLRMLIIQCFLVAGVCCFMLLPKSFDILLLCCAALGLVNGGVFPIIQSIIADLYPPHQRGRLYGLLNVATFMGVAIGFTFPTNVPYEVDLAGTTVSGWRFVYLILGIAMLVAGFFNLCLAENPPHPETSDQSLLQQIKQIAQSRTWVLIVLQGCFGMVPWDAISFLILWFEYIGFTPPQAGLIMLAAACGAAGGAIFGGWLGDKAARWSPNRGRLLMAQFSLFVSIPLSYLYLDIIPRTTDSVVLYVISGFLMAFFCNWVGPGCNEVVISEVVLPAHRTIAFSMDRLFEGSCSAMGSLFVGGVAQMYGYVYVNPKESEGSSTNMHAIADAMSLCCGIFWSIAAIIYAFIGRYYAFDRDRILATPRTSVFAHGYSPIIQEEF